jgi:nitric oxide reductase activation protein
VTLVADRSGSMEGEKAAEQRKAVAVILETLKEFSDELDEARRDLAVDLNVRTESWTFGDDAEVEMLKPLSKELTEKQRVHVYNTLADTPGGHTKDFLALENIARELSPEDLEKIQNKKLKKILIVTSDGVSDDVPRLQKALKSLRDKGIVVIGVGITAEASAVKTSYDPGGQVCKNIPELPLTLGNLLKDHLSEL